MYDEAKENKEYNLKVLLAVEDETYDGYLIQLSQMVEDKKVNSTGAKTVFREIQSQHNQRVRLIREICK